MKERNMFELANLGGK